MMIMIIIMTIIIMIIRLAFKGPDGPRVRHDKMCHHSPWEV